MEDFMEHFYSMLSTLFTYNVILMIGLVTGARLMEVKLFEEMKDFYFIDFSEAELTNSLPAIILAVTLPFGVFLLPLCGLLTFISIVWMAKVRGSGYDNLQSLLVMLGVLRFKAHVRSDKN